MASETTWLAVMARLLAAADIEELARRAVEAAREHLGIERCSLWLRVGELKRGMWGTDLGGATRDERHLLDQHGPSVTALLGGSSPYLIIDGPRVNDEDGQRVAVDWTGVTTVRRGERVLGVFYNDCAISRSSWNEAAQQRLADYAGIVGELLGRLQDRREASELSALAAALAAVHDLEPAVAEVLDCTARLFDWSGACLSYLDETGLFLTQLGVAQRLNGELHRRPGVRIEVGALPAAMTRVLAGQGAVLNHPSTDDLAPLCIGHGRASVMYQPIQSQGRVVGAMAVASDVAGRYAEEELALLSKVAALVSPTLDRIMSAQRTAAMAERHRALLAAIPDLILVYDRDARCLSVLSPDRLVVHRDAARIVGRLVTDVFGEQARPVADAVRLAVTEQQLVQVRYRLAAEGRQAWFEGRAVPVGEQVVWIARDISETVAAEEQLAEARAALDRAAEMARVGAWVLDLATNEVVWSPSMCRLLGVEIDWLAVPLPEVIERFGHAEDAPRMEAAMHEAVAGRSVLDLPMRFHRADGTLRHGRMLAEVRHDELGHPSHLLGMLQDTTEQAEQDEQRRLLEAQLAQASKMEAIGQLAGGVAHDFNNLLTTINGYAEFVLGDLPTDSPYRDDLEEIRRAAQRAASLTRQLLAFSRRSLIKPTQLDLNALVRDMDRLLRRLIGEHIELDVRLGAEPLWLLADRGQIEQILMNLAVNAKDAMPQGGRLAVDTGAAELTPADLGPLSEVEPGRFVTMTVTDTGCGMEPDVLARAFEPFFTTKPVGEGTGLGLSTVYGAVRQNRGHVTCHSEVGVGTRFTVYLPRLDAPVGVSAEVATEQAGGAERVLLVEDDPAVRGFVARSLRRAGYEVSEADSGEHALRLDDLDTVDLLITDVIMPGLNGRELAERLTARCPGLRVLFISGYTATVIAQQGLAPGGSPLLVKPFSPRELLARARELLDG